MISLFAGDEKMLASQAKRISSFCISNGVISEQDREKYDYCYEILLSSVLNIFSVVMIGLVTGFLAQAVCFGLFCRHSRHLSFVQVSGICNPRRHTACCGCSVRRVRRDYGFPACTRRHKEQAP